MKLFLDTSSLLKKYHAEDGTDRLFSYLEKADTVFVSAITAIELINSLTRRQASKEIARDDFLRAVKIAHQDFLHFSIIPFSDDIKNAAFNLMKHQLKTLDIIQIASAVCARPDVFITSDKKQLIVAKKELKKAVLL